MHDPSSFPRPRAPHRRGRRTRQHLHLGSRHLETKNTVLQGTLLIPTNLRPSAPVALIVAGSGPTNRDGNSPAGVSANTYKLIAEGLAANGIASLRYDKLFSGQSRPKIASETDVRLENYVEDAAAWLKVLKGDPRFKSVYLIGHSEGSLVGMLAAQRVAVTGFVSLAGSGRNLADVILEQLKPQLTPEWFVESERVVGQLRAGRIVPASSIQLPPQVRDVLFRDSLQPFLISLFRYDPAVEIKKLMARVLIVQGSTDLQIGVQDAQLLGNAVNQRPVILDGVNHVFKTAPLEFQVNLATYSNPNLPLGAGLLEVLTGFMP
ncbi:MAG: alpha/beta hydrolase [Pleurocapsa sp. SU_196_0]|nr:alpha/beta hydrolase [Pleurocapsa sp. SU_196_0]